jgi:hypothetical protein
VIATTVQNALVQFPQFRDLPVANPPSTPTTPVPGTGQPPATDTAQSLLNQATAAYNNAQTALKNGDFAKYGDFSNQVGQLLLRASDALKKSSGAGTSASSSTSTTTTTTPTTSSSSGRSALGVHR